MIIRSRAKNVFENVAAEKNVFKACKERFWCNVASSLRYAVTHFGIPLSSLEINLSFEGLTIALFFPILWTVSDKQKRSRSNQFDGIKRVRNRFRLGISKSGQRPTLLVKMSSKGCHFDTRSEFWAYLELLWRLAF